MSDDPQKPAGTGGATQHDRTEAAARGAELREELAITDERRAEEEEAKAHKAVEAAQEEESAKAAKRREAEERRQAVAAEAERARAQSTADDKPAARVSGAAVTGPGIGSETAPKSAAAAAAGSRTQPGPRPGASVEGPEKPELYVAAAFAGSFLFARILKKIAE